MSEEWATRIKLLILDVDGVMTDGRIIMNERGEEIKRFHARDGYRKPLSIGQKNWVSRKFIRVSWKRNLLL
jgi:3-deoxy-D-manno-octulosonate 8-phosphate phosphatase KdsC-like HAD superfamily phosphatase